MLATQLLLLIIQMLYPGLSLLICWYMATSCFILYSVRAELQSSVEDTFKGEMV